MSSDIQRCCDLLWILNALQMDGELVFSLSTSQDEDSEADVLAPEGFLVVLLA